MDRDGLGALVRGLETFQGGVVIISHNEEFTNSVCSQKWIMEKNSTTGAGNLREEGEIQVGDSIQGLGQFDVFDCWFIFWILGLFRFDVCVCLKFLGSIFRFFGLTGRF